MKSAYQEADRHTWTREELEEYEYARMRETDEKAERILVEENAKHKRNVEIATKLMKRNLTNEEIAEDTGLSVEQIQELRNEAK